MDKAKLNLIMVFVVGLLGGGLITFLALKEPTNYADCVIEGLDGAATTATGLIRDACREKFPDSTANRIDSFLDGDEPWKGN